MLPPCAVLSPSRAAELSDFFGTYVGNAQEHFEFAKPPRAKSRPKLRKRSRDVARHVRQRRTGSVLIFAHW